MSFDVVRDMPLFQKMFSDTNIGYEDLRDILLRAEIDKIKKEKLKEFVIKLLDKIDLDNVDDNGNCILVVSRQLVDGLRKDLEDIKWI